MLKTRYLDIDVVTAAKQRIKKAFSKGQSIQLSFSGGKDSIVLADIVLELIKLGEIDKSLLTVNFIDEEAMYDDVIELVKKWRMMFMQEGVKFNWWCIPVKHYNCLNSLSDEETFICWDPRKKDSWIREKPKFALEDDEWLIPYKDNYQSFFDRRMNALNSISMIGVRVAESIQRRKNIAKLSDDSQKSFPIYDMSDKDIWLYIKLHNLEIPIAYENLYRIGTSINNLRISQFFSIDTAKSLVSLGEMYPDLMERVTKREPNAYICAMYWDTEMFGRSTRKRRELEKNEDVKDYKKLVMQMICEDNPLHPDVVKKLKPLIIKQSHAMQEDDWKRMYEVLLTGDPKSRTIRVIIHKIYQKGKTK